MGARSAVQGVPTRSDGAANPAPAGEGSPGEVARPGVANDGQITCVAPATGELLAVVPELAPEQVHERVRRARAAQRSWGDSSFADRRALLRELLDHVVRHTDDLCAAIVADAGKTRENALLGEIWPVCEKLRWTIARGERYLRPERVSSGLLLHKRARIEYPPLGVIGVIAPWNFPLQNVMGPTIPALMAGNAVVVKVSEWSSASASRLQQIFDEALTARGLSTDLVSVLTGSGATGAALVGSGVDKIVFTGSLPTGRKVVAKSAETVTPLVLELGGKDPMIICDDAALDQAVHAALAGTMIASGQMCLAAERLLVFDAIHDRFVDALCAEVDRLRQGAPAIDRGDVDVGAITMERQLAIIEELIGDAVASGARVLRGGHRAPLEGGWFFEPTVLVDVHPEMRIMQEETFGPVAVVQRVRDEADAVAIANATRYGLGSTVFSTDHARARRIARKLRAGSTCINDFSMAYMAQELPFGGVDGSGYGRLNGREGLRACCNVKAVLEDRLPLHRPVELYPVAEGDYARARAAIHMIYDRRPLARLRAAGELLRGLLGRRR